MLSVWDSVPRNEQTIENLTLRLLREEVRNKLQIQIDDEGEKAFFLEGSGSGQK
jgi:hypothetical protein